MNYFKCHLNEVLIIEYINKMFVNAKLIFKKNQHYDHPCDNQEYLHSCTCLGSIVLMCVSSITHL